MLGTLGMDTVSGRIYGFEYGSPAHKHDRMTSMEKDDQIAAGRSAAAGKGFSDHLRVFRKNNPTPPARDSFSTSRRLSNNSAAAIVPKSSFRQQSTDSVSVPTVVRRGGRHKRHARLLIVEGSAEMRSYFQRFLDDRYEVLVVTNGTAALDAVLSDPPDLVLADLRTLQRDGPVLLHALKGNAKIHHIPVILTAARSEEKTCSEELNAGVDDYLIKPLSARQLQACVATHIELRNVRREAAQALSESEAKYKTLLDSLDDGVFVAHDGRFVFANPALSALLGYTGEDCIGLSFRSVIASEDFESWSELFIQSGSEGLESPWRREAAFLHRDGRRICVELCARRIHFNRRPAILGIVRDITERMQAEEALRESEERFRRVVEQAPIPIFVHAMDGQILEISCAVTELTGWTHEDIPDARAWFLKGRRIPEEAVDSILAETQRRFTEGSIAEPEEITVWTKNGEPRRWLFYGSAPMRLPDRRPFLASMAIDVTDHRKAEQALREADRLKDEFVAMLAHELRNPLAPIRNAVQVLRQLGLTDPELKWTREVIGRQVVQMSRLLDDLLDISRITRGTIVLKKTAVEISTVIDRAVETSLPLIKSRRHKLTVDLPQEPVQVEGDLTRLVQVIANLLNNAAKYTDAGGCIDLIIESSADEVLIRVRDNGMGIPVELLPNIFELFTQGSRSLDRSQGGLGLGLALVRRLIEMHGGRVLAQSAGSGSGAEFIVHLPRMAAAPTHEGSGSAGGESASSLAGVRVLVVDDNVDSAESMALLLSLDGHDVRTAFDGPGALAVAAEFQPEAVLLDIGLPGMDGYEVAKQMRGLPGLQKALMIAVTGYGQADDRARSKAAGFDHHLVKPVDPEILSALLATLRPD